MSKQPAFDATENLQLVTPEVNIRLKEAEAQNKKDKAWSHQLSTNLNLILLLPQPAALVWGAKQQLLPNAAFLLLLNLPADAVNQPATEALKHQNHFLSLLQAACQELEVTRSGIYTACATCFPRTPGAPTHLSATPVYKVKKAFAGAVVLLHNTAFSTAPENAFFHSGFAILDQLPLSLYLFNNKGVLFYCNKRSLAELQEVLGDAIHPGSDLQTILKQVTRMARYEDEQGRPLRYRDTPALLALRNGREEMMVIKRRLRSSGAVRWFVSLAAPVLGMDSRPQLVVAINADVTSRENASLQMRHVYSHLQDHAAGLAALIDNQHLLLDKTQKELAYTSSDLQQFIHAASHDLKEPVRKIRTYTSRLEQELKSQLSNDHLEQLSRIQAAAARLMDIINGVQLYTRLEEEKPAFEAVDLNWQLEMLASDLELLLQETGTTIVAGHLPTVVGVPNLLYQLFYNLITNAIKFRRAEVPPTITIKATAIPHQPAPLCMITIQDNGIGFDSQYAAKIFDPFVRLHSKDRYEGAGLGLAVCRKIVLFHHGSIEAEGKEGQGATFRIFLQPTASTTFPPENIN